MKSDVNIVVDNPNDPVTFQDFTNYSEPYQINDKSEIKDSHFVDKFGDHYRVLATKFGHVENIVILQRFSGETIQSVVANFFNGHFLKVINSNYRFQKKDHDEKSNAFYSIVQDFYSEIVCHPAMKMPHIRIDPKPIDSWEYDYRNPLEVYTGCNHTNVAWVTWYLSQKERGLV